MRLIDLDTLKQNLCGDCTMNFPKECRQIGCAKVDKQDILDALRIPIIDAVPVIRCKDCKHHYFHELLKQDYCEIPNMQFGEIDPNGYCHRAERKEHETD